MTEYDKLLNRFISQFDSLISFMGLEHEEVFQLLQNEREPWFGIVADKLPDMYSTYKKQVVHSTFLLGYSYFESFLSDMLKWILSTRPSMLPKKKNIPYKEIIKANSKDEIIDYMAKREIFELMYKNMAEIVSELKARYHFTINEETEKNLCMASLIRNCIMHNSSCADARLSKYEGFIEGEKFELSSDKVNDFGIMIRSLVRSMVTEANSNHPISGEQTNEH